MGKTFLKKKSRQWEKGQDFSFM